MRRGSVVLAALILSTCGGGSSSRPPASPSPPPPAPPWNLTGRVLGTITEQPVAGAHVTAGALSATTTDDGRFTLTQASSPSAALRATIAADGYLTRETRLGWPRSSPEPSIDLIATAAPFSLSFYKFLVRDAMDTPALTPVRRWTAAPRVSLHPFDDEGRAVPPQVLAIIREAVPRAVSAWSGGRFTDVVLEEVDTPDQQEGWIVLHAVRSRSSEFCGLATYWHSQSRIVTARIELTLDKCGCGSQRINPNVISHEIGHALGFSHVEGRYIMTPRQISTCGGFQREVITDAEALHARIAYSRPAGNIDPDVDPDAFTVATADSGGRSREYVCK